MIVPTFRVQVRKGAGGSPIRPVEDYSGLFGSILALREAYVPLVSLGSGYGMGVDHVQGSLDKR